MNRGPQKKPTQRGRRVPNARYVSRLRMLDFLPVASGMVVLSLLDEIIVTNNNEKNKGRLCFGDL